MQDLPRTFPGENRWLASPEGQEALRRVLLAYSVHNPTVGYCQSMNYVAAVLLLVLEMSEEDTFWLMVVLLDGAAASCSFPALSLLSGPLGTPGTMEGSYWGRWYPSRSDDSCMKFG